MIDFKGASLIKLRPVDDVCFLPTIQPILIAGENIIGTYQAARDGVVFTNKRIITINIQGFTGKKKDFTSLPYSKIQVFSIETAGTLDVDSELELWFSGLGKIKLNFVANADITGIGKAISEAVL